MSSRHLSVVLAALASTALVGCSTTSGAGPTSSTTSATSSATGSGPASSSTTSGTPSSATTTASTTTGPTTTAASCAARTYAALTPEQRLGQLLMVGLDTNAAPSSLDDEIDGLHVGNVILLGGWSGRDKILGAVQHLEATAGPKATGGVRPFIAVDQEGGEVRQLRGAGFSVIPSALEQGRLSPAALTAAATTWGKEVAATGINVNLAPVADTVPADLGRGNEPIGRWGREFSFDPAKNATLVPAFIAGMHAAGLATTIKHFPGLGRVTSNTDFSSTGITDSVATTTDPYLQPFAAGIAAGTDLVMVSSARYPKLDAANQAVFSRAILTDLLRTKLGWRGVTITDDMGNAKAVAETPAGDRAVRFVRAGGDVVLTGNPADVRPMVDALAGAAQGDPAFAALVEASVGRVLALKEKRGLLPSCGG